ncbi:right-handed parallel beta-helix repeat-containing protein [Clostridium sp. SHJSY1]|uniref:right-handed parallel beta-helix repeat-containing protein n=1 Tax=Clostridium sp. SHJSY1 TaxID=2942483 RepID=UPI002873F779|nr:right-handed parallel beta-helix repeat-containing protein [Clostridium sp. SHJSY1]MDS0526032.1 right-handed parallel beta-helix repeat-containing protein [Clostridium sp. SHJSY1]
MKKSSKFMSFFALLCFFTSLPLIFESKVAKAASTTYYVSSTSGNDSNNGSVNTPWKTIQKAVNTVKAGDTVIVRGGTYKEKVSMKTSGTANAYITFKNYDGETPIIDGTGQTTSNDDSKNSLIYIQDKNYIKIIGFDISNFVTTTESVPAGIRITGSSKNIEIKNCKVHGIKTTYSGSNKNRNAHAIAAYGTNGTSSLDGLIIDNCEVYDCQLGQSESVVLNGNVTNFKVTNNKVHDNDNIGIDFIGYEGTASQNDYARNGICSGNQVWNISSKTNKTYPDTCAGAIYVDGGSSITIERNKIWSSDIGIETASEHKDKATDNILVRNNLIYNCGVYGISIGGSGETNGKATNIKIFNNTAYNNDVNMNIQNYCQYNSNVIKNNIFYKGSSIYEGDKTNLNISNNITTDPKFVNPGVDFNLQTVSSAINSGLNDSNIGMADLYGNPRVNGSAPDCGCYESKNNSKLSLYLKII